MLYSHSRVMAPRTTKKRTQGRETARGNVDVGGFVILTFTKKTDVKDFEKNFGDKDM